MKRCWSVSLLLLLCAAPVRAHFVWIVPDPAAGGSAALVIFSDNLKPDENVPIAKIGGTELFTFNDRGHAMAIKATPGKSAYRLASPGKGGAVVGGLCRYGVVQRGKAEPFLLVYSAKALVGATPQTSPAAFWLIAERLPLQIALVEGKSQATLLWHGKPLAGAEVVLLVPGQEKSVERQTDKNGRFPLERPAAAGVYGIRARHVEQKAGEQDGKKYKEVRYYATLTFPVRAAGKAAPASRQAVAGKAAKQAADPAATKLLRDARAARANWEKFRGFSADLAYNHNGQTTKGHVDVSAEGRVKVDLPDAAAKAWAQRQLQSVVDHRLDSSAERDTPCAFIGDNTTHPLGRAIKVLNDELHSSYRIRGREIIEVNRTMKGGRFTITVLENRLTPEKKYLPTSYVVNTWAGEVLRSSMAFHQTWQRVGTLDLPKSILVVTATGAEGSNPSGVDARKLTLSNLKLPR